MPRTRGLEATWRLTRQGVREIIEWPSNEVLASSSFQYLWTRGARGLFRFHPSFATELPLMKIGSDYLSRASYPVPVFSRRTSLQSVWLQPLLAECRDSRGRDRHADQTTRT